VGTLIFSLFLVALLIVAIFFAVKGWAPADPAEDFDDNTGRYYNGKNRDQIVATNRRTRRIVRLGAGIFAAVLLIPLISMSIRSVDATDVGVPITLGQPGEPLGPGPHLVLPWTDVQSLDVKTQVLNLDDDNEIKTITSDRITTPVDVSVYFSVDKQKAPTLLLTVGPDYVEKIVRPLTRSTVYDKGSFYSAEKIQNERDAYETSVFDALKPVFAARGILLEKIEIRKIQLPDDITKLAQQKITAEENLKRAKVDAETKVTQAEAQARANKIIADSATSNNKADVCQLLLVQAMAEGKITGPLYINPCGSESGTSPLLTKSAN
jgi:regulator of protease activity HflC (stomatin/prohibitin superfamily)